MTWTCGACTFHNEDFSTSCSICGTAKPGGGGGGGSSSANWSCSICTFHNTRGNSSCGMCGTARPGGGGGGGGSTYVDPSARERKRREEEKRRQEEEEAAEKKRWDDKLQLVIDNESTEDFNLQPSAWFIEDAGALQVAEAFKSNTSIRVLNLAVNGIGPVGTTAIAEMMKVNTCMEVLNMRKNNVQCAGLTALAEALGENKTILDLDIRASWAEEEGALVFGRAIQVHPSLQFVTINSFRFDIPRMFDSNLASLFFENENLEETDMILVAYLATRCPDLTKLILPGNHAKGGGAAAICAFIKTRPAIVEVDLSDNEMNRRSATEIAGLIKEHKSLRTLRVRNNPFGDDGVMLICNQLMEESNSLAVVDMQECVVRHGTQAAVTLTDMTQRDNTFQFLASPPALTEFQQQMLQAEQANAAHRAIVDGR